jgi:murein DD-endopeptidase MepM/ murein hydrolase activator NlpD
MNPEDLDLDLPQPPEGVLDPSNPWYSAKVGERTWMLLKAKLTGRKMNDGTQYSSTVNLTEADADKLIENLKKDPRGYPQFNDGGGGLKFYENYEAYQGWLVEEYLEKPFRKQVDAKIEEAEIQRVINQRKESKVQPMTLLIPSKKEEDLLKVPEIKEEPVEEPEESPQETITEQQIPEPVAEPQTEPVSASIPLPATSPPTFDPTKVLNIPETIPEKVPNGLTQNITKLSETLDNINAELSAQIVLIRKRTSILKKDNAGLELAKFLVGQQIENYSEFLNDLESQSREIDLEDGYDIPSDAESKPPVDNQVEPEGPPPTPEKPPEKQWWEFWKEDPNKSPRKASSGLMSTAMPAMAEGGISAGTGLNNIIKPGIYDNPTVGNLAPGTAIIPLNRNYGKDMFGNYDEIEYMNAFGEVMASSRKALLGSVLTVYGDILSSFGPLAGFFNKSLPGILQGAANILGAPLNLVLDMLGGPAYAGTVPNELEERKFYKSWKIYFEGNRLIFEGGVQEGSSEENPTGTAEFAKDILTIGPGGEGLGGMGGTNVSKPPAWIPYAKSDSGKLHYISGFGWRWGRMHTGIDLAPAGYAPLKLISPFDGKVSDVNRNWPKDGGGGYGNYVEVEHKNPNVHLFYGHMKEVSDSINQGSDVKAGQVLGTTGTTGRSEGVHVHWEVRKGSWGQQVDPVEWTHQNKPSFAKGGSWQLPSLPSLLPSPIDLLKGLLKSKQSKRNYGADYKRQELILSAKASGGSGLADIRGNQRPRLQQSGSISRPKGSVVVKQTEPEVPKLDPNLTAIQNWTKLFPQLARKVKPGQSGYDEIQKVLSPQTSTMPSATPTTTAVATESKVPPKQMTMQMPSAPSTPTVTPSSSASSVSFVQLDMNTNDVKELVKLRRIQ